MAYYLGKDVGVVLTTENASYGMTVSVGATDDTYALASVNPGATIGPLANPNFDTSTGVISNLTGVDVGIGSTDEDVVFMGANTPLKAEVHKETTISLTKKKNSAAFDVLFNGDGSNGNIGRWGVTGSSVRDGLTEPDVTFGFRCFIQLKGAAEILAIRNAQMTGHTISLNADGTQEETIEFTSQVNPFIYTGSSDGGLDRATPATEL